MKNKVLVSVTAMLMAMNIGSYSYYNDKLSEEQKTNKHLKQIIKSKTTEIANLEDVIQNKNEKIKQDQKVIKNQKMVVDEQNKTIENQKRELNNKAKQIEELQNKIKDLQNSKATTSVNFDKREKGSGVVGSRKINVIATAYVAHCTEGCTGTTATGVDVSDTIYYRGVRVIAVDTNLIKLNSLVRVDTENQSFTAMAIDRGGGIIGNRIDVLVGSEEEAINFGRQQATVTVLKEGD